MRFGVIMDKRKSLLCLIDIGILAFSFLLLAAECGLSFVSISGNLTVKQMLFEFLLFCVTLLFFRAVLLIYNHIWRYATVGLYIRLVLADFFAGCFLLGIGKLFDSLYIGFAATVFVISFNCLACMTVRLFYQFIYARRNAEHDNRNSDKLKIGIAIVGAGNIGSTLAEEFLRNPCSRYQPVAFFDIDPSKCGQKLNSIPVYNEKQAPDVIRRKSLQEIMIALPDLSSAEKCRLLDFYSALGCKVKIYDYPLGQGSLDGLKRSPREIHIEDLLFRDTINVDSELSRAYYREKVILVTGGGGSIGSELCRQLAKLSPRRLIIFDIYENNAYDIQQELLRKYEGATTSFEVIIGSVRDVARLEQVFEKYRPQIVIHAAAHKHVPLMEASPSEAVKNNVFGTYNTANAAEKYGVEKFVLISTDKAVNPTNIMGASKRMCEMIVQARRDSSTKFVSVRFGNVLGSNGSVIPLFRRQIESGGPVTVTDKRIIRYFMTIPEAVQLVLQTGAMARRGDLYVLDMGNPVRIYDLACNMIRLAGYEPEKDIKIEEIGLRPGEKLFEELLIKSQTLDKTDNSLIFIERDKPYSREEIERRLSVLRDAIQSGNDAAIADALHRVVSTFMDPEIVNQKAEESEEMKASELLSNHT